MTFTESLKQFSKIVYMTFVGIPVGVGDGWGTGQLSGTRGLASGVVLVAASYLCWFGLVYLLLS